MITTTCWILWIPDSGGPPWGGAIVAVELVVWCFELPPQATSTSPAARQPRTAIGLFTIGELVLEGGEVLLSRAAHRAEPGLGDVLERGAGRDPSVGVAIGGVVDEPA